MAVEAPPTEIEAHDDDGFGAGIAIGFGLAALLVHVALTSMGDLEGMYRDFGQTLPLMTRVTISPVWRFAVPLVGGIGLAVLIIRRPRSLWIYIAMATACGIAAAMTWWFPSAPIYELANAIK